MEERSLNSLNIFLCALTGRGSLRDDSGKIKERSGRGASGVIQVGKRRELRGRFRGRAIRPRA